MRDALFPGPSGTAAPHDLDLTTDALPAETERLVRGWADDIWTQGARYGTIGCRKGTQVYEITTHRAEVYVPDSRKPEVTFGTDLVVDLSRRDFTINALALRLPDMELVDPFDGLGDLAAGRLRTPLDPEISFGDDPLRMLRAARFAARFSLEPDPALTEAVERMHDRLSIVSAERIRDELDKIVMVDVPSVALWFVVRTGLAGEFLPELPGLALEQDPIHRHKDVLGHTLAVVDKTSPNRLLRLAALFHDVGKPRTRAITDGGVSFHHHEVVGARMTRTRMEALRYAASDIDTVVRLVELHLRFHTYRLGWTDKAVRRYVRDAGPHLDLLERADPLRLHDAQRGQGQGPGPADGRARGPHHRAGRAGGAARAAPRPGRQPDHGPARHRPGPRRRRRVGLPHGAAPRRGAARRGGGGQPPAGLVGRAPIGHEGSARSRAPGGRETGSGRGPAVASRA